MKKILTLSFAFLAFVSAAAAQAKVKLGIDVLADSDFVQIKEKKILLFTNLAGRASDFSSDVEILKKAKDIDLVGLLVPEHGYYSTIKAGKQVSDDSIFGIPAFSLYGQTKEPTKKILERCEAVVADIQDIGIRSYTYVAALFYLERACAKYGKPLYVLDRPNPLGGEIVDGGTPDSNTFSYVCPVPIAYAHGCTSAELALMFNEEGWLGEGLKCDLRIIKMQGWSRNFTWEDTGLNWTPTSPHVPTVNAARGLAVLGVLGELGIASVGVGTTSPFQYLGSPKFDFFFREREIKYFKRYGLNLIPVKYSPFYGTGKGKTCRGYYLSFDKDKFASPYAAGFKIIYELKKRYPEFFDAKKIKAKSLRMFSKVTGRKKIFERLAKAKSFDEIYREIEKGKADFLRIRRKYLLY